MPFTSSPNALSLRPTDQKAIDASAVRAIAQAAVNVELFTIPLYMGTLYSISGTHQITSRGNDFYKGRLWPGPGPTAKPQNLNEEAFNLIFSVFIEEMLHLQIAANVAGAIQAKPCFTSRALQNEDHGWTCYGKDKTVVPHIVDLLDTTSAHVRVNIAALSREQLDLFLAIEQPDAEARKAIKPEYLGKYFPSVPFKGWKEQNTENDLPMFGTIGWMYQCYWDYLSLRYEDGTTLLDYVFEEGSIQNDLFNSQVSGHEAKEYPGFIPTLAGIGTAADALFQINSMLSAITDQGEGSLLPDPAPYALADVQQKYRADRQNLEQDYPGSTDTGAPAPSADAAARADNDAPDHYERYLDLQKKVAEIETWPQWHAKHKQWEGKDLETPDYDRTSNPYGLPSTDDVAAAINRMAAPSNAEDRARNLKLFTQAAVGSIAGVTTVLDSYWNVPNGTFPFPAMSGAGDRMGICWAVFGEAPDLSIGIGQPTPDQLQHSCQALAFDGDGQNTCANVEIFHACRGSNACKAQGGCGFVQPTTGGGLCGHFLAMHGGGRSQSASTGAPQLYSVPSDNKCATFGGCAVPISASQLLNQGGEMQLFDFTGPTNAPKPITTMSFKEGEKVHDVAYRAYRQVMEHRGKSVPKECPPPTDLRLVFIPST